LINGNRIVTCAGDLSSFSPSRRFYQKEGGLPIVNGLHDWRHVSIDTEAPRHIGASHERIGGKSKARAGEGED
jgi:hypothetical protein